MGNIRNYFKFAFFLLSSSPLLCNENNEVQLFSLDYLYPQTYFFRVEAASKELWSDLDLFLVNHESLEIALQNNYLQTQFKKLFVATQMLFAHKGEARNYLPDDIEYLIEIVNLLVEKCAVLQQIVPTEDNSSEFCQLLARTKETLENLLMENEEVSLC